MRPLNYPLNHLGDDDDDDDDDDDGIMGKGWEHIGGNRYNWRFPEMGVPPVIIRFDGIFPYEPSIFGYPDLLYVWKRHMRLSAITEGLL